MSLKTISFATGEQGICYYHQWPGDLSQLQNPRGWVHIMHGMSEHSARYQQLAEYLNQQGFLVTADDHRGHGKTGEANGNLFHFADSDGWNQLIRDQWQIVEHIAGQNNLPLIILGHSMGSFMALHFCQLFAQKLSRLKGLVLSGSNYAPPWLCRLFAGVARLERHRLGSNASSKLLESISSGAFNNAFKPNRTEKDWISSDTTAVDLYIADPYCGGALSTQSWYDFFRGLAQMASPTAMQSVNANLPIYLFSGELDPVGGQGKGVRKLATVLENAGVQNIDCKLYSGGRHEMHNEINREQVFSDLLQWIRSKIDIDRERK